MAWFVRFIRSGSVPYPGEIVVVLGHLINFDDAEDLKKNKKTALQR
jgi:hypothetical protein